MGAEVLGRLYQVQKLVQERLTAEMGAVDVFLPWWGVLRHVRPRGGCSQREIAERCGHRESTVAVHLDRIHREGLIDRRRDTVDRRISRVYFTDAGRRHVRRGDAVAQRVEREVLAGLSVEETELLAGLLDRLLESALALGGDTVGSRPIPHLRHSRHRG